MDKLNAKDIKAKTLLSITTQLNYIACLYRYIGWVLSVMAWLGLGSNFYG